MRVKNISQGFVDATGFHPIRTASDYDPDRAGDDYSDKPKRRRAKKVKKAKKATKKAKRGKKTAKKAAKKKNPLTSQWKAAKVRRNPNGEVQLLFTGVTRKKARKTAKRRTTKKRR